MDASIGFCGSWRRARLPREPGLGALGRLSPAACAELLQVLTAPSQVRADVIRQFHERGAGDMVELLILCEEDDFKRAAMIEALRSLV